MLHILNNNLWFPPVTEALEDGLLAMGGNITTERLLLAYSKGVFPWYSQGPALWWSPDPRFVLFPSELKVSKSMQGLMRKGAFKFTVNKDFAQVIQSCRHTPRRGQNGTWLNDEMEAAYNQLHQQGYACSAEAWHGTELAGGLYGVRLGNIFFGESMFSHRSNASKFAFIKMVTWLMKQGIVLIDCQVHTDHLESLGARMIPRKEFIALLQKNLVSIA